jgi:hypothetical protein
MGVQNSNTGICAVQMVLWLEIVNSEEGEAWECLVSANARLTRQNLFKALATARA